MNPCTLRLRSAGIVEPAVVDEVIGGLENTYTNHKGQQISPDTQLCSENSPFKSVAGKPNKRRESKMYMQTHTQAYSAFIRKRLDGRKVLTIKDEH